MLVSSTNRSNSTLSPHAPQNEQFKFNGEIAGRDQRQDGAPAVEKIRTGSPADTLRRFVPALQLARILNASSPFLPRRHG
jgi:hypothetical protein